MNSPIIDLKYIENKNQVQYIPACHIIERLQKNGFAGYIAGGAVRDMVLKRKSNDIDILTNASLDKIQTIFADQKVKKVGRLFPICIVNGIEVSSGRGELDKADFLKSDLAKRDFTMNAMAFDPVTKKIVDPFNGKGDIKKRVIRFTDNPEKRIKEDPVRMIRACRFAAMIDGHISKKSLKAIIAAQDLLDGGVAKERIGHEIIRAMALSKPSWFFKALKSCDLLTKIFPSLERCYNLDGGPHHGETVFEHCMLVGDAISPKYPILRLAGFLHDAGKFDAAITKHGDSGLPFLSFPGHEKHTKAVIRDLVKLKFSSKDIAYIKSLIKSHMRPLTHESTPKAVRRLLAMLDDYNLDYKDFMRMRIADKRGNLLKAPYTLSEIRIRLLKLFAEIAGNSPSREEQLNIKGDDIIKILGVKPGPEIGRIKQILFKKIVDDPELNNYDELKKICLLLKIKLLKTEK